MNVLRCIFGHDWQTGPEFEVPVVKGQYIEFYAPVATGYVCYKCGKRKLVYSVNHFGQQAWGIREDANHWFLTGEVRDPDALSCRKSRQNPEPEPVNGIQLVVDNDG